MSNERSVIYLNGSYVECRAKLSVLDRGLLFADAVYEGFGILMGRLLILFSIWIG